MTDLPIGDQAADRTEMSSQAVLFSGGRDSTLASLTCRQAGSYLHLLSFDTGLGYGGQRIRDIRLHEMRAWWGASAFEAHTIPIYGLVRQLCFVDLVDDVRTDGRQLILLGEFVAILAAGIIYCRNRGISELVFGATFYQSSLPEQQHESIDLFREACDGHGVALLTPVWNYESELAVKSSLLEAGLTAKSLEGSTLLADLDDAPPRDVVQSYLRRKLPQMGRLVSRHVRGT